MSYALWLSEFFRETHKWNSFQITEISATTGDFPDQVNCMIVFFYVPECVITLYLLPDWKVIALCNFEMSKCEKLLLCTSS